MIDSRTVYLIVPLAHGVVIEVPEIAVPVAAERASLCDDWRNKTTAATASMWLAALRQKGGRYPSGYA